MYKKDLRENAGPFLWLRPNGALFISKADARNAYEPTTQNGAIKHFSMCSGESNPEPDLIRKGPDGY